VRTKNQISLTRKTLYGIMLFVLFFSAFGTGNMPSVNAQEGPTDPPLPTPGATDGAATPVPDLEGQIVGGALADQGEYPWQVALVGGTSIDLYNSQFCAGSLVSPQWVLTAAHCITNNGSVVLPSSLDVVVGIRDLVAPAVGYQRRDVTQIIRHPAYNSATYDNDIALLQLASSITIGGSGETKVSLIPPVPSNIGGLAGFNSWVTGWGYTNVGWPAQLLEVQLPIIANSTCNSSSDWDGMVTDNMLCAGPDSGTQSACSGDSGGPLVVWNSTTGQWNLAGVVSWGPTSCNILPSVFTRVSQYWSWIQGYLPSSTLSVSKAGTGSGTVSSTPSGISCGADCSEIYSYNTLVTLTAIPAADSMFSGWSGACSGVGNCIVTMIEAKSVIANFTFKLFNDASKWTPALDLSHGWTVADFVRTVGDVDGDGDDDLVGFGLDGVYVSLSNGSSFASSATKWTSAFDLSHGWTVKDFVRTVGDVDGDGDADLVGFGLDGVYVALSNGSSFASTATKWTSAFDLSHGWTVKDFVRTVGDVDGDGDADLIGFGLDGVYVALSNGSSFASTSTKWTSAFDLSHGWTVKDFVRTVGDVNGDGKADLIGFGLDGVYVGLSNGSSFASNATKWTSALDLSHGWTVADFVRTVGDVNGDGKADVIGFGLDGVYIALSNGSSFAATSSKWTNSFDLSHGWTVAGFVRIVGDVNNDNKADLVGFGLDGVYIGTAK